MRIDALWARALIAAVVWVASMFALVALIAAFVPDTATWATISFFFAFAYSVGAYAVAFFWVDR